MANFNRVVSDGNAAAATFYAAINAVTGTSVPYGAIAAFNLSACPSGWVPADGTGGTPDLRGYFIRESGGPQGLSVGLVQADQIANHSHAMSATSINPSYGVTAFATGSSIFFASSTTYGVTINAPNSGNFGSETRPKNIALLMCMYV